MESAWDTDLSTVLRMKTAALMNVDLGFGKLDVEFFNAVSKNFKIRHYVRGVNQAGEVEVWSVDQVIAHQQTGHLVDQARRHERFITLHVDDDRVVVPALLARNHGDTIRAGRQVCIGHCGDR